MTKTPYSRTEESSTREKRMREEAPRVLEGAGYRIIENRSRSGMQFVTARHASESDVVAWVKCAWHPGKLGHCAVQLDFPSPDKRPKSNEDAIQLIADKARRAAVRGATHILLLAADEKVTRILAAYLMPLGKLEIAMREAMAIDQNLVRNGHSPSLYVVAAHGHRAEIVNVVRNNSYDLLRGSGNPDLDDAIEDLMQTPRGQEQPTKTAGTVTRYRRDPQVRAHVLARAHGCCELCNEKGFKTASGEYYLEAHHIISLGEQGPDTLDNVIALCPNHHRQAHYGVDAKHLELKMLKKLTTSLAGRPPDV